MEQFSAEQEPQQEESVEVSVPKKLRLEEEKADEESIESGELTPEEKGKFLEVLDDFEPLLDILEESDQEWWYAISQDLEKGTGKVAKREVIENFIIYLREARIKENLKIVVSYKFDLYSEANQELRERWDRIVSDVEIDSDREKIDREIQNLRNTLRILWESKD